jgi:predicted ester cyclase
VNARGLAAIALAACASSAHPTTTTTTATCAADAADSKRVVTAMFDAMWTKRDPDAALRFYAPDLVNHAAIPSAQGAEGIRTIAKKLLVAFPDITMHVDDVIADGDRVVLRTTVEGTHTGTLEFQTPLPPTGKHFKIEQWHTYRVRGGAIVETWMAMDRFDFQRQLGLVPDKTAAK